MSIRRMSIPHTVSRFAEFERLSRMMPRDVRTVSVKKFDVFFLIFHLF